MNPQHMTVNPINDPLIAVIAATPYNMSDNSVHNVYPSEPYFSKPHFGSSGSKSSGGTGYESERVSNVYPYGSYSYASNHMYCPRCMCNYEPNAYHSSFDQQQQEKPQKPVQDGHYESVTASQQCLMSSNNNLTTARPPMRRTSSDSYISRHKPSPCRPLDKLLSSSSVV